MSNREPPKGTLHGEQGRLSSEELPLGPGQQLAVQDPKEVSGKHVSNDTSCLSQLLVARDYQTTDLVGACQK